MSTHLVTGTQPTAAVPPASSAAVTPASPRTVAPAIAPTDVGPSAHEARAARRAERIRRRAARRAEREEWARRIPPIAYGGFPRL